MSSPTVQKHKDSVVIEQIIIVILLVAVVTAALVIIYRYISLEPAITPQQMEIKRYTQLVQQRPSDPNMRLSLAYNYQKAGDYENAIKYYKEALKLNPKELAAIYNLGVIAQTRKQYPDAVKLYKQVLELKPSHILGAIGLGEVYIKLAKFDDAVKVLDNAIQVKGSIVRLRILKAQALEGKGDKKGAVREYNEVLKYVPDHEEAVSALKRLK